MYFRNGAILPATCEDGFKGLVYNEMGYFELKNIRVPDLDANVEAQRDLFDAELYLKHCLERYIISTLGLDSINFDVGIEEEVADILVSSVQDLVSCMLKNNITVVDKNQLLKQLNNDINTKFAKLIKEPYSTLLIKLANIGDDLLLYPRFVGEGYIIIGINSSGYGFNTEKTILGKAHQLGYTKSSYITTYADNVRRNTMVILGTDDAKYSYLDNQLYEYYVYNCYANSWVDYATMLEDIIVTQ